MQKKQTYKLTKSVRIGATSAETELQTLDYFGTRASVIVADTLATMVAVASLVTVSDVAYTLFREFGVSVHSIDGIGNCTATLSISDVLPVYDADNADGFVGVKTPTETVAGNVVVSIVGRYYTVNKNGDFRFTGVAVKVASFGNLSDYVFRCDKHGVVTPRVHSMISMWRLIEKDVANIAHMEAEEFYRDEKKRTTVAYRLSPIYTGIASGS